MEKTKKVVINTCFGGFGFSQEAYKKLIEWGIPSRKYMEEIYNPETKIYDRVPENEGEVIFDDGDDKDGNIPEKRGGMGRERYWEVWIKDYKNRSHPLLVRLVEELGSKADGQFAKLKVVEVPDGVDYTIEDYDGVEHVAEVHQTWA